MHLNKSHDFSELQFPQLPFPKLGINCLPYFFVQDLLEAIIDMINTLQAIKWDINIEIVTVFDHFYCSCYYCPLFRFTTKSIWWTLLTDGYTLYSILCEEIIGTNKSVSIYLFIHSINMYWMPIIARHCSKPPIIKMYPHQPLTVNIIYLYFSFGLSYVTFRNMFKLWETISLSIKLRRHYLSDLSHFVVSNTRLWKCIVTNSTMFK